ncbi:DEAD/DEAH box helicase [Candidatus Woesearchaeota archaeon]|nr:DEAD/DEAH box helicase [Candidatus Woesearchaeota archaeon]
MRLKELKSVLPEDLYKVLEDQGIVDMRPAQKKAVDSGVLEGSSLLVCTPTASGKTLIAELAAAKNIIEGTGKAVYIVPLKALAGEKFREFRKKYDSLFRIALSIGDIDSADSYLVDYDLIICTAEKFDSLIRHHAPWLKYVKTVIIDEVHLLNDPGRGPTLEILITILRQVLENVQLIALSATIGNPEELAGWLEAGLIVDRWRPVELKKAMYYNGEIEYHNIAEDDDKENRKILKKDKEKSR